MQMLGAWPAGGVRSVTVLPGGSRVWPGTTAAGQSPFTRVSAPGGPVSSAGTPLVRIGRGEYVLASAATVPGGDSTGPGLLLPVPAARRGRAASLSEDEVKQGAKEYLKAAGFHVTVAWGRQHGIDIRAVSGAEVMLLEAKGSAMNPPQQVNYFLGALGRAAAADV